MVEDAPIPLDQYAFISAGLSDGLALDDLLLHLDVDPHAWEQAQLYWLEELVLDAQRGALMSLELGELQANARQTWARSVPPLDEDLRAWVDFDRTFAQHEDPLEYLADLGLLPADLLRLHQLWSTRLSEDDALQKKWAEILAQPPEPVTVPPPRPASLPARDRDVDGTGFFRALDDTGDAVPFEEAPQGEGFRDAPDLVSALPVPPTTDLDATSSIAAFFDRLELPFFAPVSTVDPSAASADPAAPPEGEASADPSPPGEAMAPPHIELPSVAYASSVDSTTDGAVIVVDGVLPFGGDGPAPAPISSRLGPHPDIGQTGEVEGLRFDVDETAFGAALPTEEALPFAGNIAPSPIADLGTNIDAGSTSFFEVAALGLDDDVLPFDDSGTQALVSNGLTLQQLAAVTVELEAAPEAKAAVLAAYHLTSERYDEHGMALLRLRQSDPEVGARWAEAKATYQRWKAGGYR